ncbi:MAG: DUF3268 family zinc-finger domain-containing protein [Lachnospiraceae bacterium]|nr:DUF3268 family zinc-finger domain-containing protein [Lachnospiraceae bacterium]
MAKKQKKLVPADIWCPYCGRKAVLRPASYVYKENCLNESGHLYVCTGYPACDSYVGAHDHNLQPKGTLANSDLRHARIEAHRALDAIWKEGYMTRKEAYIWIGNKMNLGRKEMHIGQFSYYRCQEVINCCSELMENRKAIKQRAA